MNSMCLRELKQQLVDGSSVGFKNFSLMISSDDNTGTLKIFIWKMSHFPYICVE